MTVRAFVLVNTSPNKTQNVIKTLKQKKIKELRGIDLVSGRYDLILDVDAKDIESLSKIVNQNLRKIAGITKTETLLGLEL